MSETKKIIGYWDSIAKVNQEMELFELERSVKNKKTGQWETILTKYAEVKERVIAFRKVFPLGTITTEKDMTENYIEVKATVSLEGQVLATGYAREVATISSNGQKIIKPYALENAETSAIGRALGFCGFGIKTGIASADDMKTYEEEQNNLGKQIEDVKEKTKNAVEMFNKLNTSQKAQILNVMHVSKPEDIEANMLMELCRNAK